MGSDVIAAPSAPASSHEGHGGRSLGAFLCWAVVFADIGTSVYYVPGILYGQVQGLAGLFVTMTLVVFVLLTLKYAEVSVRFPEGGGVVTVSARGLNPWAGAVGGMFILVDYFLTAAISSLSGVQYFAGAFVPHANSAVLLLVTLVVLVLLGVLNWWGIKESAIVSAAIAVVAFLTDMAILVAIFTSIPLSSVVTDFHRMFQSGVKLNGVTLITGYAGAFLAFSGLESISQLSPVMRSPRSRTVSIALALVAITVGITSPLLTFFSTTALHNISTVDPNTFISVLAAQFGGRGLEVVTAISASVLLIFASNTAIIGSYHVFLALSRMQFFPSIIERQNKWRETPHISIMLATGIPILVLIAVRGNVTTLGDMYAFGLLGAFSLTCIALDVMRWRERHGSAEVAYQPEPQALGRRARTGVEIEDATREGMAVVARTAGLAWAYVRKIWPDIRYYLGFLTTVLVVVAWSTNLISKPLATVFGGGLTIIGVGISIANYRHQQRIGRKPVFPLTTLYRIPNSVLVVLSADSANNRQVVESVATSAEGRTVIVVYLGEPAFFPLQPMAINDPYFRDDAAKAIFSETASTFAQRGITGQFIYRIGGPTAVLDVWRIVRPVEIVAESRLAKALAKDVSPEYLRFQQSDGVTVAHLIKHHAQTVKATPNTIAGSSAGRIPRVTPPGKTTAGGASAEGRPGKEPTQPGVERNVPETEPGPEEATKAAEGAELAATQGFEDYVWTGTQLVHKSELPENYGQEERPEGEENEQGKR